MVRVCVYRITMKGPASTTTVLAAVVVLCALANGALGVGAPTQILFVGNSFTFGRVNPVMNYGTETVYDLTLQMARENPNDSGANPYEPKPWGGVPALFKAFTLQRPEVGTYNVSLSTRNAATLRGHYANTNGVW